MAAGHRFLDQVSWWCDGLRPRWLGRPGGARRQVGRVLVVTGPRAPFRHGKVRPASFFPAFGRTLARHGVELLFQRGIEGLAAHVDARTCILCLANEERAGIAALAEVERWGVPVFNAPSRAAVIADKRATNRLLAEHGIAVPPIAGAHETRVFSNAVAGSNAPTLVLEGASRDPERYETRFVDTRVTYRGVAYYTSLRLLCVGPTLLHAYVRASRVEAGATVHNRDTPLDPGLIESLQARCVEARAAELTTLAARLAEALGPGFYAHDVLLERGTGELFVCETGWKFDDFTFRDHLRPIADRVPSQRVFFDGGIPRRSAEALRASAASLAVF